jgi:hypothetical protein
MFMMPVMMVIFLVIFFGVVFALMRSMGMVPPWWQGHGPPRLRGPRSTSSTSALRGARSIRPSMKRKSA